ncbi:hypothetical protein MKEN_00486600 [Mycena kentingensis (nom. inval.)]|nr:hypothetical protein MKEN_00486600 [Mycena kentingensis (nom. inval.)]
MHQPSKAYANLSKIALRRGRINALYAMRPELDRKSRKKEQLPQYSYDAGNGAALLRKRDRYPFRPNAYDTQVICSHLDLDHKSKLSFKRWGRARLPNGQIARSEFGEEKLSLRNIRRARCVKVRTPDGPCIMYVRYYFVARNTAFALGDAFGSPDADLLRESYGTVWSSKGVADYMIASVNDIDSVVAMVPYQDLDDDEAFFLVEKPGLDMATVGGFEEPDREEEGAENEIAG